MQNFPAGDLSGAVAGVQTLIWVWLQCVCVCVHVCARTPTQVCVVTVPLGVSVSTRSSWNSCPRRAEPRPLFRSVLSGRSPWPCACMCWALCGVFLSTGKLTFDKLKRFPFYTNFCPFPVPEKGRRRSWKRAWLWFWGLDWQSSESAARGGVTPKAFFHVVPSQHSWEASRAPQKGCTLLKVVVVDQSCFRQFPFSLVPLTFEILPCGLSAQSILCPCSNDRAPSLTKHTKTRWLHHGPLPSNLPSTGASRVAFNGSQPRHWHLCIFVFNCITLLEVTVQVTSVSN